MIFYVFFNLFISFKTNLYLFSYKYTQKVVVVIKVYNIFKFTDDECKGGRIKTKDQTIKKSEEENDKIYS